LDLDVVDAAVSNEDSSLARGAVAPCFHDHVKITLRAQGKLGWRRDKGDAIVAQGQETRDDAIRERACILRLQGRRRELLLVTRFVSDDDAIFHAPRKVPQVQERVLDAPQMPW
jgi:hypothetical protein